MSQHREPDPLEALRAANPVSDVSLPPASLARIRARVYEEPLTISHTRTWGWTPLRRAGIGLGAVAALALVLFVGSGAGAGLHPGGTSGPLSAMCVEQYDLASLLNRTFAFDGTVTAIEGDTVTFAVNAAYRGVSGGSVTLDAPGMTGTAVTSAGGPRLGVGGRFLVAGDATFAWACGFTQPYDAGVAAAWATALGG